MSSKFIWHGLTREVRELTRNCISCQQAKIHHHTQSPLEPIQVPAQCFDHVHIDLVGPLPPSLGCTHLLTVVDCYTRWPEAIPLSDTSTKTFAWALLCLWIARFGVPTDMSSDRGVQFTSKLWSALAELYGTKLHQTTAYHPQANGLVERFHRHLKSALHACLTGPSWLVELPWVLLGIRRVPKDDLGSSSGEIVYGSTQCLGTSSVILALAQLQTSICNNCTFMPTP